MFNLESAIIDWRQQMLAAGIGSPVPLEELENHLREDIDQLMGAGVGDEQAFTLATRRLGEITRLRQEFGKSALASKSTRWERWVAGLVILGAVIPLGSYALLKNDLSFVWRLAGFANLALLMLACLACNRINQWFPVIRNKRTRISLGGCFAVVGVGGMVAIASLVLPYFSLSEGQLTVLVLWGLTFMAALGSIWAGLEEAAQREAAK